MRPIRNRTISTYEVVKSKFLSIQKQLIQSVTGAHEELPKKSLGNFFQICKILSIPQL